MFHYRPKYKQYIGYPKPAECQFCDESQLSKITERSKYALVAENRTFYDVWEMRKVTDHLMVIPKRHVHTLSELNDKESLSIMKLIAKYEEQGYNVYARGAHNTQRSVHHQHTHLIKTEARPGRFMFYLRRPYLLIKL